MPLKGSSRRFLAAAQLVGPPFGQRGQIEFVEEVLQAHFLVGIAEGASFENGADVLFNGEFAEDRGFLRQIADAQAGAQVHGQVGDDTAVELHRSAVRFDNAHHHVEGGGLAGPVGTEQTDDFARLDVDGNAIDHRPFVVFLHQTVC